MFFIISFVSQFFRVRYTIPFCMNPTMLMNMIPAVLFSPGPLIGASVVVVL